MPVSYAESQKNHKLEEYPIDYKKKAEKALKLRKCTICGMLHYRISKYCSKRCECHNRKYFTKKKVKDIDMVRLNDE